VTKKSVFVSNLSEEQLKITLYDSKYLVEGGKKLEVDLKTK
jgi:hypothetical protein